MPRTSPEATAGYILEEVLAYLVRQSGYSLLTDPSQDSTSLVKRGNGLRVVGRGGEHQVDVLGELDWVPAFTFPLRLFLEAKFQGSTMGVPAVRNAVGVLADLNQRIGVTPRGGFPLRYRYAYALFSVSGFAEPATNMALAHEISLIDLSGPDYADLIEAIRDSSRRLFPQRRGIGTVNSPQNTEGAESVPRALSRVRYALRQELGTDQALEAHPEPIDSYTLRVIRPVIDATRDVGNLFIGMGRGPYMLLLRAEDRVAFLRTMKDHPVERVSIHWTIENDGGRTWTVEPLDRPDSFRLSFRLPKSIAAWIFRQPMVSRRRALLLKRALFPHIYIPFKDLDETNHLFRLDYTPPRQRESLSAPRPAETSIR
jgi:hypothetical protein